MIAALLLFAGAAALSAAAAPRRRLSGLLAAAGCAAAAVPLFRDAFAVLLGGATVEGRLPLLSIPGADFRIALDPLSALFLLPLAGLAPLAALHGAGRARRPWRMPLLAVAILLVAVARDAILFLVAWESMSLLAFLLLSSGHESGEVRRGGRAFLVAGQLGGACLLAFFALLASDGLDFGSMAAAAARAGPLRRAALAILALLGFGTKLGFFPLHSWAPAAYPAAPGHVGALVSGAMSKMGAYGLLRSAAFFPVPPEGLGLALLGLGSISALWGIVFAVGQRDMKRALAWSSVENVGVIAAGSGLALFARARGAAEVAHLAALGALLHVLHHAGMKGLLFLGAATVEDRAGSADLERLGGLLRRMPGTGAAFLVGAGAIAALPPFCGFAGEWLLLLALLRAAAGMQVGAAAGVLLALLALAAAGGLAVAAFLRLFSVSFLGQPRSGDAEKARDPGPARLLPLAILALVCVLLGLFPQWTLLLAGRAAAAVSGGGPDAPAFAAARAAGGIAMALWGTAALLLLVRRTLARGAPETVPTWGCGYARPGPRFQTSGSSFAAGLVRTFSVLLAPRTEAERAAGRFPRPPSASVGIPDRFARGVLLPLFAWLERKLAPVRRFQDGRLNRYLLQMALLLLLGLLWAVFSPLFLRP